MGMEINVGSSAAEELYGPNAVTGNLDDIEVTTGAGGTHVSIKGEGAVDGSVDKTDKPDSDGSNDNPDGNAPKDGEETPDGDGEDKPKDVGAERNELKETINNLGEDLKGKGFDFESAIKELETNGELSDATLTKLEEAGYPKAVIKGYIKAAEIVERDFENAVYGLVGNKEEYTKVISWANLNAPKSEQAAYDAALDRGDLQTAKLYMDAFKSRMGEKFGSGQPRLPGAPAVTQKAEGFATKQEMTKATSDKRYGRDSRYTTEVQNRILKTSWL